MRIRPIVLPIVALVVGMVLTPQLSIAQPLSADRSAASWAPPRTGWGIQDLQGVWDYRTATRLERPDEFEGREFLSNKEVALYEHRAATRADGRPPDDPRSAPSVHAPEWLDYGKTVVGTRRTSLITVPRDGRIPPPSEEGQRRASARRTARRGDSRAWWDGDTLVLETTNFSEQAEFRGSSGNLHLVERFTRSGPDALTYEFTVTDPTTWTSPWTVTFPLTRAREPVYEYACHDGNHGLLNILTAARSTEP